MSIPVPASTTRTTNSTATPPQAGFSSVKLPAALVQHARDAAQPLRRSVAGQIEYWATLGRVVEHTGLTAQEARTAIEGYEASARETFLANAKRATDAAKTEDLSDLKHRILAASTNGNLQSHIRQIVKANRQQAPQKTIKLAPSMAAA